MDHEQFLDWADRLPAEHPCMKRLSWLPSPVVYLWIHPATQQELVLQMIRAEEDYEHNRLLCPQERGVFWGVHARWGELWFKEDHWRFEEGEMRLQLDPKETHVLEWAPVGTAPPPRAVQTSPLEGSSGHRFETPYICWDGYRRSWILMGEAAARTWLWQKPEVRHRFLDRHARQGHPKAGTRRQRVP